MQSDDLRNRGSPISQFVGALMDLRKPLKIWGRMLRPSFRRSYRYIVRLLFLNTDYVFATISNWTTISFFTFTVPPIAE